MNAPQDIPPTAFWRVAPQDTDPLETREWLDAFDAIVAAEGGERATFLLRQLSEHARRRRVQLPPVLNTPYRQHDRPRPSSRSIPATSRSSQRLVRDRALERARDGRAREPRAPGTGRPHRELRVGGRSVRGRLQPLLPRRRRTGDLVYFQPHSAPGVYARAFLEGRLDRRRSSRTTAARPAATGSRRIRIRG